MPKGVPKKQYTGAFKQQIIEEMRVQRLSNCEIARKYEINEKQVRNWERIYLTEGAEGLYIERRGRKPKSTNLPEQANGDLLTEVQRLRAEVDYLKNLNALVLKRGQLEKKRK